MKLLQTLAAVVMGLAIVGIILAVIASNPHPQTAETSAARSSASGGSKSDIVVSYLGAFSDQAAIANSAMVNSSTLEEAGVSFQGAKLAESVAYGKYVARRETNGADTPSADEVHRLFQEGLGEMILGSEGKGNEYIVSGAKTFKHSAELANAIVQRITAQNSR